MRVSGWPEALAVPEGYYCACPLCGRLWRYGAQVREGIATRCDYCRVWVYGNPFLFPDHVVLRYAPWTV